MPPLREVTTGRPSRTGGLGARTSGGRGPVPTACRRASGALSPSRAGDIHASLQWVLHSNALVRWLESLTGAAVTQPRRHRDGRGQDNGWHSRPGVRGWLPTGAQEKLPFGGLAMLAAKEQRGFPAFIATARFPVSPRSFPLPGRVFHSKTHTPTRGRKAACSFSAREKRANCATRLCVWPVGRGGTNRGAGLPFKKVGENQGAGERPQDHQHVDKDGAGFPFFGAWRRERGTRQVTPWGDFSARAWPAGSPRPPLLRTPSAAVGETAEKRRSRKTFAHRCSRYKNGPVSVSTPDMDSALRRP